MEMWKDSVAIVTGGASGLGAASAEALAQAGLKVAIFDLNVDAGEAKAAELGGSFHSVDVSDAASVTTAMNAVVASHGVPRVMVNCAGIGPASKTVSRGAPHDPDMFSKVVGINLIGSFICASTAAAHMVARAEPGPDGARGVIINTASIAAFDGQKGQVAYAASKGGIVGMTLPMARDLARDGIRVMTIAPGIFATPMLKSLPQEVQDSLAAEVTNPARLGDPNEYARLAAFIVEMGYLNGEVIRLDAALRMR